MAPDGDFLDLPVVSDIGSFFAEFVGETATSAEIFECVSPPF
jgi:hypothetical protein